MDSITTKSQLINDTMARLKSAKAPASIAMSSPEQRLADLVSLSPEARAKASNGRKVNGYLQLFSAALKWINGGKALPDLSPAIDRLDKASNKVDTKA